MMKSEKKPNVATSQLSSCVELMDELRKLGLNKFDDGARLTNRQTCSLSAHMKCFSAKFLEKFKMNSNNPQLTCFAGIISRNGSDAYAFVWARLDHKWTDIDLAIWGPSSGVVQTELSAVYEPTFSNRTDLSADAQREIDGCASQFSISSIRTTAPRIYEAFKYSERVNA